MSYTRCLKRYLSREKSSIPALVTQSHRSNGFTEGSGNEVKKFIAGYCPSAREGKETTTLRPYFFEVEVLGLHSGWCVSHNVHHKSPGGATTLGFEGTVQCSPASFPITELCFCSRPGSWSYPCQGQDFWGQVFHISKGLITDFGAQ